MDLGKAFSYVFDDENWLSTILIGGLILLIPIVGQLVLLGFMVEVARNVWRGNPRPLPNWSNFGEKLTQGFWVFVVQLVYALPVIILMGIFSCIILFTAMSANGSEEAAVAGITLATACLMPLAIIIGLILQPLVLVATARYVQTGVLGDALRFGEVWNTLRSAPGEWVVLWLIQLLCGFVAGLGTVALFIGVLFTTVYAQAVFGHVLGQTLMQRSGNPGYGSYPPQTY